MSTGVIITISFLAQAVLLAIGIIVFLFFRMRKLKTNLTTITIASNEHDDVHKLLADLFDEQINRTRKQIDGQKQEDLDDTQTGHKELLCKRIDFLTLEKDIAGEHVTDEAYWEKIYLHLSEIIAVNEDAVKPVENSKNGTVDPAAHEERISKYQAQLSSLHQEFDDYRTHTHKLTNHLSSLDEDAIRDEALKELMEDFQGHDDRLHKRLSDLQRDNDKLEQGLSKAERESYLLDYQLQKNKHSASPEDQNNPSKASEEEIHRLHDIIDRQYSSIDDLKNSLQSGEQDTVAQKLEAVEKSQQELKTCIEVLEMENDRLMEELAAARLSSESSESNSNGDADQLSKQLAEKEKEFTQLEKEHGSLQQEFMNLYDQTKEA